MPKRSEQIPIAVDQLINTIFGGWADETISSRAHRMQSKSTTWNRFRKIIDGLFCRQKAHCREAYESESERRHLSKEYRN